MPVTFSTAAPVLSPRIHDATVGASWKRQSALQAGHKKRFDTARKRIAVRAVTRNGGSPQGIPLSIAKGSAMSPRRTTSCAAMPDSA